MRLINEKNVNQRNSKRRVACCFGWRSALIWFRYQPGHESKKQISAKDVSLHRAKPKQHLLTIALRHGFSLKEIAKDYFPEGYTYQRPSSIKEVLSETKLCSGWERGARQQRCCTYYFYFTGRQLSRWCNNLRAGGSRRIEGDERTQLKAALNTPIFLRKWAYCSYRWCW